MCFNIAKSNQMGLGEERVQESLLIERLIGFCLPAHFSF